MPLIRLARKELRALQQVFSNSASVDWQAYDRAKVTILSSAQDGGLVKKKKKRRLASGIRGA
jgi:hypothetical protein